MRRQLALAVLVVAASSALAPADTFGPPFGANSYATSIDTVGSVEDTDDYVASLLAGEKLSVTVSASRASALLPALSLVAPDGAVTALAPPVVVEKRQGKVVTLSKFGVATTGRWAVRVAGKSGTQGGYTIKFAIGAARAAPPVQVHLGGADPLSRDIVVDGIDGALLDVAVAWPKAQSAVHIGAVKDPAGAENTTGSPPAGRNGSAALRRRRLHQGTGPYTVNLSIDSGEVTCAVTTKVTPPARPRSRRAAVLSAAEPLLEIRATPIRGDAGLVAHLVGASFATTPLPRVFFGAVAGTGVVVAADGTAIDVVAPAGAAGSTVEVAVVHADGQASVRAGHFVYVPPPTITDLTNAASQSVRGGATAGGASLRLVGSGLLPGHVVRFGNRDAAGVVVTDSSHADLVTPFGPVGLTDVSVIDEFARTVKAPFQFEYKDAPAFGPAPYFPAFSRTAGGITVSVTGTGFEPTDRLTFDGAPVNSTYIDATARRFVTPAMAAGLYTVGLVDRLGLTAMGPTFEMKDPPLFAFSPYSPAFSATAGGATITITGIGFESTDQLLFDGAGIASTFVNATARQFTLPALSAGVYSVHLVDRLGNTVTGSSFEVKDPPAFAATPYSPGGASTAGGATITITGTGFESTDRLRFDGADLASTFVDATTRRFSAPALAAGAYPVQLTDRLGQVATGPAFELKGPPVFATSPYSPATALSAGGTTVTITGSGFESTDQLRFGGADLASTFVGPTTRRFDTPAIASGSHAVQLVDRFGVVATGPAFEIKDPPAFATSPYSPAYGATAGGTTITITGTGFESTDELWIDGASLPSTFVNSTTRRFSSPAIDAGFYPVQLTDRLGQTATGPNFEVRKGPAISAVEAVAGAFLDPTTIAAGGGATIRVTGAGFGSDTTVSLAGTVVTVLSPSPTQFLFTAPAGSFGIATLAVTDGVGQTVTSNALTYVGFGDETVNRQPGSSSADNFLAARGAVGDLDGDGAADDLVITANYYANGSYYSPGSRTSFTRILFGTSGTLADVTDSNFPAVAGRMNYGFTANAVAVGDLDGQSGQDILIGGYPVYVPIPYSSNYYYIEATLFSNDGAGTFTKSSNSLITRTSDVTCTDSSGSTYTVFRPGWANGNATAFAVGDLDRDGRSDIVMATDHYRSGAVWINPSYVTFTPGAYYDPNASTHYGTGAYYGYTTYFASGTRVWKNQGGTFEDVSFPRMPLAGTYPSTMPCFNGRDVALGDIDGDASGSLDLVVTWDDPTTTTPFGLMYYPNPYGYLPDIARVATKVLLNDGNGFFTDQTSSWMPAGSSPEFWQGNRVELADLDADGRKDLVVLHANFLDGSSSSISSLRILRNAGPSQGFVDVTSNALPSVPLAGTLDDNLRGTALLVRDVDGDGRLDILVGTKEQLVTSSGAAVRRTRFLRGDGALHFALANDFLPATSVDTGEAADLLLGDLAGTGRPSLVLLSELVPAASSNGERLRVFDWK